VNVQSAATTIIISDYSRRVVAKRCVSGSLDVRSCFARAAAIRFSRGSCSCSLLNALWLLQLQSLERPRDTWKSQPMERRQGSLKHKSPERRS
jgi:hypothetical protein